MLNGGIKENVVVLRSIVSHRYKKCLIAFTAGILKAQVFVCSAQTLENFISPPTIPLPIFRTHLSPKAVQVHDKSFSDFIIFKEFNAVTGSGAVKE